MIKVVYSYIDYKEERVSVTITHKDKEDFERFKRDYKGCKYFRDLIIESIDENREI